MLTGNSAADQGGGAANGTLNNCSLTGNSAWYGGGAANAALNNCTLAGNSAPGSFNYGGCGGGAYLGTLTNCTLAGNTAYYYGGGTYESRLVNCIVYYNNASVAGANYSTYSSLAYCCTTPSPGVTGNTTRAPLFVNTNGWANLRLQPSSPCINSGSDHFAPVGSDLDGNPRIAGGAVDMGAYEFESPASVISYAWLMQYGLPTDGLADYTDPDQDCMNNWQEWVAGTVPTNALSTLRMLDPTNAALGITVRWQSVGGRTYFLQRASSLGMAAPFSLVASNIIGRFGTTTYTDASAAGPGPFFYRVGVQQ
ncbi:MAG: hypothetical protein NT154_12550 [Verrucomicrobia bacterium]|nr:hypothetical protein [Verrucomicrobiota bacterium]